MAVLTAVELSLAGFLGLTLYRLGEAFVTANYLGGPFFATTGGLLFGLLVGGHVAMACCFPNAEGMFRRRLEQSVRAAWLAAVAEAEATAAKYLDETERLHQEGVRFLRDQRRDRQERGGGGAGRRSSGRRAVRQTVGRGAVLLIPRQGARTRLYS